MALAGKDSRRAATSLSGPAVGGPTAKNRERKGYRTHDLSDLTIEAYCTIALRLYNV